MRVVFLICFQLFCSILCAQLVDSTVIRQVDSLVQISRTLTGKGEYDQALEVNASAEKLALKHLGYESAAYGSCCFNHGRVLYFKEDFQEAEKWYLKGKAIIEEVVGKRHVDYAKVLSNLAILHKDLCNYREAESLYLEAKEIFRDVFGEEHLYYARCLNNLAILYLDMGLYELAEPLYVEAKDIREKLVGSKHPDYSASLNNLAVLYWHMGKLEEAESLYIESRAIWEEVLGKEHPNYASSLNNLAILYVEMGNYVQAEPLYLEARDIREKVFGKEHPDYAECLNNLANLYSRLRQYEKAELLYLESLDIRESVFGKSHLEYAQTLNNLAVFYRRMGNFEKAESRSLESIAVLEKLLGKQHPTYASGLNNLALLYQDMGDVGKAELLWLKTNEIREQVLGKGHPDHITSLNNLANLYEELYRYSDSEPLLREAHIRSRISLVNATSFLSEQELAKYVATFQYNRDELNSHLLARHAKGAPHGILPSLVYDHALFYKGFLLSAASRLNSLALASPESVEINLRLKGYRRRLAAEYTKPIAERKGIADLEEKANLAEKELARTVAGYAEALRQVKWEEVQATLSKDAIALEFVHFRVNFPNQPDSVQYAVLLLRPGAQQPLFIPLFEETEFDHRLATDKERKSDYVNDLYAWAGRGLVELGSEEKSLYDLIWSKIEAAGLESIQTVYYSPSGVLHRLNLGAIAVDDETILSDRYNLVALNSTRQLVIPSTLTIGANDALLVGGVNFETDSIQSTVDEQLLLASRSAADASTQSGSRGGSWSYLKWTEKEVENITTTLAEGGCQATRLSGSDATEEAIKAIGKKGSSPRILHIATHGFFFPDPAAVSGVRSAVEMDHEAVFKWSDNPMIRSGLILAGGNYAWQHGRAVSPDKEDGILTAYEISQMNLSNTELVVLSACETGLGDIQGNEGVYGLQRAFKIAGAKYLIMSLWQVPDRETMQFMTTFYKNWLEEQMTIPDAFRKTQLEMRDRFFNPYSWAGFVLVE